MRVIRNIKEIQGAKSPIITIGNFDGVHLGHQKVLKTVRLRAHTLSIPSIVYTFEPHPLKVVAPHKSPPLLATPEEKICLIEATGIDYLILAEFTKEFASQHPKHFVRDVLVKQLHAKEVWVGHDYKFGKGKKGTVQYLRELGNEYGFKVTIIPAYRKKGAVVSSSRIRKYILEGKVKKAALLLGRPYAVSGNVIKGRNIGKVLGFPTANLKIHHEVIPKNGIYAVRVYIGKKTYNGVANIGFAPTFTGRKFAVEVHVMDFHKKIYGNNVKVAFIKRLRGERVFKNIEGLIKQIEKDVEKAKKLLTVNRKP